MADSTGKKVLPPYVSYRTFRSFVDRLQQGIPARIDRSYWGELWSGSSGTQLVAALRFMGLVDAAGTPTNKLRQLVAAKGSQRAEILRQLTTESFSPVLQGGSLDPAESTYAQLEESFRNQYQVAGDVARKCIKFFILLSGDAGISLSPFMVRRLKKSGTTRPAGGTKKATTKVSRTIQNGEMPTSLREIPQEISWDKMVLSKFPTFDPGWSDDVKLKWFEAFSELLQLRSSESAGNTQ